MNKFLQFFAIILLSISPLYGQIECIVSGPPAIIQEISDKEISNYVTKITNRLAKGITTIVYYDPCQDARSSPPEQTIILSTGLVAMFDNEESLAAVIAHEINHIQSMDKYPTTIGVEIISDLRSVKLLEKAKYNVAGVTDSFIALGALENQQILLLKKLLGNDIDISGDASHPPAQDRLKIVNEMISMVKNKRKYADKKEYLRIKQRIINVQHFD